MRVLSIMFGIALTALAGWAMWHSVQSDLWEDQLDKMIFCGAGVVAYWFSDEWSSWTGRYGMTREHFYTQPESYIKFSGALGTLFFGILLLSGKGL